MSSSSPSATVVEKLFSSIGNMDCKRASSKDTIERSTGDVVEEVLMNFLTYANTKKSIEKDMKLTWQEIKDIFAWSFKEYLQDQQVYVKIHRSGLYKVAYKYSTFPCEDIIHWIVSHTDPETMILSSASGTQLSSFIMENYHHMFHLPHLVNCMDPLFYAPHNNVNTRYIIKHWVKELSKFKSTPNHVYKTKSLRKAYQLLIIFACGLSGQESTNTFL